MAIGNNVFTAIGLFATCGAIILGLLATYPAVKAFQKGRKFLKWYIFSFFLFPFAFIASFLIRDEKPASK